MTYKDAYTSNEHRHPPTGFLVGLGIALTAWAALVAVASVRQWLAAIPPVGVAATVALGIGLPTLAYFLFQTVRGGVGWIGLRGLTGFHVWRIPAALAFFWFGAAGALPPLFVALAGVGDLMAGLLALWVVTRRSPSQAQYLFVHVFGLIDFVVAVGTGVTLTLMRDPLMDSIRDLPLALIPYFGVALSGATHLMAFDLLRRGARRRN